MKTNFSLSWIAAFVFSSFFATHNGNLIADPLITYPITVNDMKLRVEVANEPKSRSQGLMERRFLSHHRGMIFVFPTERRFSIWMKNTPIDLTVIFANKYGRIINIEHMTKNTLDSHTPSRPAMFALEVNQDSPVAKGVEPGDLILGLEKIPPASN